MFDLSRISDVVGGFLGQSSTELGGSGLLQVLSDNGVDLAQLDGMAGPEMLELLEQNGIDVAGLDPAQLSDLAGQLSDGVDLQSIADLLGAASDRN